MGGAHGLQGRLENENGIAVDKVILGHVCVLNDTAATEIYTEEIVVSVRCV